MLHYIYMIESIQQILIKQIVQAVEVLYGVNLPEEQVTLQETRKEFEGQITLVTFPITKYSKKSPENTGMELGDYLQKNVVEISDFNVIKGFLNISLVDSYWISLFRETISQPSFGQFPKNGKKIMVEYSSPNTNKPLHLGHVRNNLLGYSIAEILNVYGYDVIKANLVNDRGIHICKSMLAWQKFGNGETPESSGMKGDHLVGKYYVRFENEARKQEALIFEDYVKNEFANYPIYDERTVEELNASIAQLKDIKKKEIEKLDKQSISTLGSIFEDAVSLAIKEEISFSNISKELGKIEDESRKQQVAKNLKTFDKIVKPIVGLEDKIAEKVNDLKTVCRNRTALMQETQEMLRQWEAGDESVIHLWKTMNGWVYEGFDATYKQLGVDFNKYYYESDTYLLGKGIIQEGLESGVFFRKEDNSVWIDLTEEGLDEKLVLRGDGTSVYITQDLGTAQLKHDEFGMEKSVYVVGNEQDYHFKVLFAILSKLGKPWAEGLYHLSYGMVDLPSGKMKSREGTVVDADDLMHEMITTAADRTEELGKTEGFTDQEKDGLYHTIGMGALKYFLLKVDPKKRLLFDPKESVDFQGHTGPFIQYTYARIKSVLRRADAIDSANVSVPTTITVYERDLIQNLAAYPTIIELSAKEFSPAQLANYIYETARLFNKFYHEVSILKAEDDQVKLFRLSLSEAVARIIKDSMHMLGIQVPERM